jgi:uncharacterized protein
MTMEVKRYDTADEFLRAAGPFLEAEEAVNSLILRLALSIAAGERTDAAPPVLMTASDRHGLEAAALMTIPPRTILLYAPGRSAPQGLARVADALLACGIQVQGCMGPTATAKAFAEVWTARTGQEAALKTAMRIYELHRVVPPARVPGSLREASMGELDLAADWRHQFMREALGEDDRAGARAAAERQIAAGQVYFWEEAGRPVCQAVASRSTRRGVSVGAVYTPPELRRRGYGTACVAALSQRHLDAGREFCCLYTDLANPTSNSIYQKIGYVPVTDVTQYSFAGDVKATHKPKEA